MKLERLEGVKSLTLTLQGANILPSTGLIAAPLPMIPLANVSS